MLYSAINVALRQTSQTGDCFTEREEERGGGGGREKGRALEGGRWREGEDGEGGGGKGQRKIVTLSKIYNYAPQLNLFVWKRKTSFKKMKFSL